MKVENQKVSVSAPLAHMRTHAIINPQSLLRLRQVLELIPVSKSSWWAGVKSGRYPAAIKLGAGTTCWRASEVLEITEGDAA